MGTHSSSGNLRDPGEKKGLERETERELKGWKKFFQAVTILNQDGVTQNSIRDDLWFPLEKIP